MSAIADDAQSAHKSTFIVPPAGGEPTADGHEEVPVGAHARPVDVPAIVRLRHPSPERRRYFLSSFEPSGDFDAVIVAVTDDGRRRYFTTRDGASLTEVDEVSFERRRESGTRSMLELDERELGELEVELDFVRPVRGRDPIAEADAAAEAESDDAAAAVDDEATHPEETDPDPDPEDDPPPHRATFVPVEVEVAVEQARAESEEHEEFDDVDDPVTEEFEAIVMESTTHTFEGAGAAASDLIDATDAAPEPAATPMSATEAISQVALAKGIAFVAHRGQIDRSGLPYIDHPGRIAERFDAASEPVAAAAAWLHDVLEDSDVTAQELFEAGVLPVVTDVVQLLTRTPDISPDEYYARIRRDPVARRVKLADIDDNTARWRLRRLDYETQLRLVEKYRYARQALTGDA
ncbi:hypothetical protein [Agromyces neolithicus]|uniref:HD domain-containing protein n=1 Tax=Agromyces neolithicus TaxID=269420 RepID=A0ABP4YM72_9MICO